MLLFLVFFSPAILGSLALAYGIKMLFSIACVSFHVDFGVKASFFMCLRWVAMGVLINLSPRIGGIQFDLTTHALRISHGEK